MTNPLFTWCNILCERIDSEIQLRAFHAVRRRALPRRPFAPPRRPVAISVGPGATLRFRPNLPAAHPRDNPMLRDYTPLSLDEPLGPPPAAASIMDPGDQVHDYPEAGVRPVNIRFVLFLFSISVALMIGVWMLHGYQMRSMASALLERSDRAREAGDMEGSAEHLRNYLKMVPEDTRALRQLAFTLDELAETPQEHFIALGRFEELLRREQNAEDVRHKLVDLSIYFGRYSDAIGHLRALLNASPEDSELYLQLGRCYEAISNNDAAMAAYDSAVEIDPRAFEAYERLIALVREQPDRGSGADSSRDREAEVKQKLDELVAANPDAFEAYVLRARHDQLSGRVTEALLDARNAWQLAPDEVETLLLATDLITGEKQASTAETYFRADDVESRLKAALAREPQDARIYHALAKLEISAGRPAVAEERLRNGLQADPSNIDLRLLLADVLVGRRDFDRATVEIAELVRLDAPRAAIEFLRARVAMAQNDWLTARSQLELAATAGRGDIRFLTEVHLLLARCYRELGQAELEIATYRRALQIWTGSVEARIGLGRALTEAGRLEEALSEYRKVMHVAGVPATVARLMIRTHLHRPEAERDWSAAEELLDELARDPGSQVEALVLRAELDAARGEPERSRSLLRSALDRRRGQIEIWLALADLELRTGRTGAAAAVIDEAEGELGSSAELLAARIRLVAAGEADSARRELASLEGRVDEISRSDRLGVLLQLASAYEEAGESDSATRNWRRAAELEPNNLAIRLRMLGLAIRGGAADEAAEILKEIRRIEGADGFYSTLSEAAHCMLRARQGERSLLLRARQLLQKADRLPAGSPVRVQLAFAELCELEGDTHTAVEHYRRAIELGERSAPVIERAVRILYDRHRYADAEKLIDEYLQRNRRLIRGELGRLAAEVSLHTHNRQRAIERARQAASADSGDFQDHLWLARLLAEAGQTGEAETALRRARELAPARPEVWISSVRFAAQHGRREQIPALLEDLAVHLPAEDLPAVLAQCYEAAGDLERAGEQYQQMLGNRPDHAPSLWAAASFLIRTGDSERAEPLLRKLLAGSTEDGSEPTRAARRALAAVVASAGTHPGFLEALDLLQQNLSAAPGSVDDLLIQARLLATRPERRYRSEAVAVFESLDQRSRLALEDLRLLVQLHLELGDWERGRVRLQALLAARPNDPDVLAFAVRAMISNGETGEATQQWLATLETLDSPAQLRAAELKARLLIARGHVDQGLGVLRSVVDGTAEPQTALDRQSEVARILVEISLRQERLGNAAAAETLAQEAERLYRKLLERRSDETLAFASFLARRWRADEALALCDGAWGKLPAEQVASTCVEVLRDGRPDPEHFQRVIARIADAAHSAPGSAELQLHLANAAHLQGDYALAERSYRRVLELSPGSPLARNELALLLALQGRDAAEALELINGAIETVGPLPHLLDTRATVYLALGRPRVAITDARAAIDDTPTPVRHFHLAQALLAEKDNEAARAAFRRGVTAGLHEGSLHPLERSGYKQMQAQMQKL